jgi:glycosyltransferase involved in cell wall biosynthesis
MITPPTFGGRTVIATLGEPAISVIITTYNPRGDLLRWTLESFKRQSLPRQAWELILVDNNSSPAIDEREWSEVAGLPLRVVRERQQGQIYARVRGLQIARGELLVFADDDNYLQRDYLERALEISRQHPEIGTLGGIAEGVFERWARAWQHPLFPYLAVRDHGDTPITSSSIEWGPWEPIGAGLVVRRSALDFFFRTMRSEDDGHSLGRKPRELLSGDDSLIAKSSVRGGFTNSYRPELRLKHFIKAGRLKPSYLRRLIEGYGHSHVKMQAILGQPTGSLSDDAVVSSLIKSFRKRYSKNGRVGAVRWYWHVGHAAELCGLRQDEALLVLDDVRAARRRTRCGFRDKQRRSENTSSLSRHRVEGFVREAARLLPVPDPGEPAEVNEAALHEACGLVRRAAALTDLHGPKTPIAWRRAEGLRTFRHGRRPEFHIAMAPRAELTFSMREAQPAFLVMEGNPLVAELPVDVLLNESVIHSHVFRRVPGGDGIVVPLLLDSHENRLTLSYHVKQPVAGRPALFLSRLEVLPDDDRQWPARRLRAAHARAKPVSPMQGDAVDFDARAAVGDLHRISIVIPCLNSAATLERTITSLLAQDYDNLELILMDGGSTDGSAEIIQRYRNRLAVVRQGTDAGQVDALNEGFRHATGGLRGWLCADDELLPGCLHAVNHFFRSFPDAGVVSGGCERVYADGHREITQPPQDAFSIIALKNRLEQPSTFWRSDLHAHVGDLDARYRLAFDWDLWARFAAAGADLLTTSHVFSRYHFSEDNKTSRAGNLHALDALRLARRHGPLDGLVADCFQILYRFDLLGCLDRNAACPRELLDAFRRARAVLADLVGLRYLDLYNLHFASLQERGLVWWR